jgi:hypothetical protein
VNAAPAAIFPADRRNNSSTRLLRRLSRPQDAGTLSNSTLHTCHAHPSTIRAQRCLTLVIKRVPVCPTWQDAVPYMTVFHTTSLLDECVKWGNVGTGKL